MSKDMSVIIPTYNRAEDLYETLKGMAAMEKGVLPVEFVIIDNGSTDRTKSIVESFSNCLTVRYLFEPKKGKNRALNRALQEGELGDIVVFTDDDVDVSPDWLISIHSVCDRWPNHSVFGGRINVIFPEGKIPRWTEEPYIHSFAFAGHHISEEDSFYKDNRLTPFGPNFWLRREILDLGYRFDERMGPGKGTMGDEAAFLSKLMVDGYQIVYAPRAVVGHRIQPDLLKLRNIWRRAITYGRGDPYLLGISKYFLFKRNKKLWQAYIIGAIFWNSLKVLITFCSIWKSQRISMIAKQISWVANHCESFIAINKKGPNANEETNIPFKWESLEK